MANNMKTMQGCCCGESYTCAEFGTNVATITANSVIVWKDNGCALSRSGTSCSDWDYSGADAFAFTGTILAVLYHQFGDSFQLGVSGPAVLCGPSGNTSMNGYRIGLNCTGTSFRIAAFGYGYDFLTGSFVQTIASLNFTASGIVNGQTYSLTPTSPPFSALCVVDTLDVSFTW